MVDWIRLVCSRMPEEFIEHDGDLEESPARLDQLLERAHIVLYPVDCISHEAALHLKAHCKRAEKPFIPLRNSSISSRDQKLVRRRVTQVSGPVRLLGLFLRSFDLDDGITWLRPADDRR